MTASDPDPENILGELTVGLTRVPPNPRKPCNPPHQEAVFCNNCEPPGWFERQKLALPDEILVTQQPISEDIPPQNRRVQLVVLKMDGTYRFYPMDKYKFWKINPTDRTLIIGKGMGRIIIPLETIDHISPQEY